MNLGTIVYDGKIYNLDYMKSEEIRKLLEKVDKDKKADFAQGKKITKRLRS